MSISTRGIIDQYVRRTPGSARLAERARRVFPSGITHDSRRLDPYGLYIDRAEGSRKWDVDGHEYVDYAGGHGALLLGHNHPQVRAAVERQLSRGTHLGGNHELEIRWGELVQQLIPSAERVRFTSSGTEATLLALRLARAATGKPKIVRFLGHFHGWHDHMAFGVGSHFDGSPTPGILPSVASDILLAPANDIDATCGVLERDDVAGVIIEPTGASWGQVPVAREFLLELREMTRRRGIVLIFDEVISGFRCAPGGAQAALGITPDMTTLAKIIAGGLPGGAVTGRADIMEQLSFDRPAGTDKVPHQGTFNANPLSAAAGIATLEIIAATDACDRANLYAAQLRAALNQVIIDESIPWVVYGTYSGFHICTNAQVGGVAALAHIESGRMDHAALKPASRAVVQKLRLGMILHGVDLFSWPGGPTSAVHSDDDLRQTAAAFRATVRLMREEGDF